MPAGGELAALFARRMEGDSLSPPAAVPPPAPKSELAAMLERRAAGGSITAISAAPPQAPGRLLHKSTPPASPARPPLATPPRTPVASVPPESAPLTVEEPVRVASTAENEELKAKFEERNLEVGIPTPGFLVGVRNNLKKTAQMTARNVGDRSELVATASPGLAKSNSFKKGSVSVGDDNNANNNTGKPYTLDSLPTSPKHDEKSPSLPAFPIKRNSFTAAQGGDDKNSHQKIHRPTHSSSYVIDAAQVGGNQKSHHKHHLSSSDIDLPVEEKAASKATGDAEKNIITRDRANSDSQQAFNARRRRMVASRSSAVSVTSSTSDLNNNNINETAAGNLQALSARLRRERLLAKVRASQISTADDNKNSSKQRQQIDGANDSPVDMLVVSPKRDEFEVLFADHDFGETTLVGASSNKSQDSIANEMHDALSAGGSAVTLPTNNAQLRAKITTTSNSRISATGNDEINVTAEKSRIQHASSPEIRGNGNYRRENYNDKEAASESTLKKVPCFPKRSFQQNHSSMPSYQEQRLTEMEDYLPDEPPSTPYHLTPAYPFRQSSSQLSQMSGITTPSCFPQEFNTIAPSSAPSSLALQQPLLIGGPIPETYSANSSVMEGVNSVGNCIIGGPGAGLSAFSSGMEAENRRLREILGSMTQKLEEKDAIIGQLIKRISDLEIMNCSAARGAALANQSNMTFSVDLSPRGALLTPNSVSSGLLSAGARSTGIASDPHAKSSSWEESVRHAFPVGTGQPSTDMATFGKSASSVNSESACLAAGSSSHHHSQLPPSNNVLQASTRQQEKPRRRSTGNKKVTPSHSTSATSSTASVTTATSSKSGNPTKSILRSKSYDTNPRSLHRRSESGTSRLSDERKFVC